MRRTYSINGSKFTTRIPIRGAESKVSRLWIDLPASIVELDLILSISLVPRRKQVPCHPSGVGH